MKRWMLCSLAFALCASLAVATPMQAEKKDKKADEKKKTEEKKAEERPAAEKKPPPDKAPNWSEFANSEDVNGEVFKADETGVTIRVTRPGTRQTGYRPQNIDTVYKYAEQGLARRKDPPPFFDEKGLKRTPKSDELEKLRKPIGVPGYAIDRTDIKTGDIVNLKMARPRNISATKAKPEDLVIKYAIVTGEKGAVPDPKKK